jgi:hypothetical protein
VAPTWMERWTFMVPDYSQDDLKAIVVHLSHRPLRGTPVRWRDYGAQKL